MPFYFFKGSLFEGNSFLSFVSNLLQPKSSLYYFLKLYNVLYSLLPPEFTFPSNCFLQKITHHLCYLFLKFLSVFISNFSLQINIIRNYSSISSLRWHFFFTYSIITLMISQSIAPKQSFVLQNEYFQLELIIQNQLTYANKSHISYQTVIL